MDSSGDTAGGSGSRGCLFPGVFRSTQPSASSLPATALEGGEVAGGALQGQDAVAAGVWVGLDGALHLVPAVVAGEVVGGEDEEADVGLVLGGVHLGLEAAPGAEAFAVEEDVGAARRAEDGHEAFADPPALVVAVADEHPFAHKEWREWWGRRGRGARLLLCGVGGAWGGARV